jgi:cell division protein DivIC
LRFLSHIPAWLKNKYFIALSSFAVILLFLDKNDVFTQMARQKEQRDLDKSKVYYTKEINELNKIKQGLINDPATIEKFARENCLMKRDNEDLFLVSEKPDAPNN